MSIAKSNLVLHNNENNSESQKHLEENASHFTQQCLKVLELLNQGKRLTVKVALGQYDISSLPRRIKDLRDRNGIENIKEQWIPKANGKNGYKEWYMEITKRPTKKQVIEKAFKQLSLL